MHGEMQVVRRTIGDRPWGSTLGALGVGAHTVQLTLRSEDRIYRIAFDRGVVVAATSPLAADSVARVALTSHHITPGQANEINRCVAAAPNRDDVDVLAEVVGLDPEQTRVLRNRVIAKRAARTFSVDQGEFEIEERMPIPLSVPGIDVRAVIFMGARLNLSEERLRAELRQFGARFVLKPGVFEDLARYEFTPAEAPILEALRTPTSLAELEVNHRDIDPRATQAVVYALASCEALAELDLPPPRVQTEPAIVTERPRTATRTPPVARDNLATKLVRTATRTSFQPPVVSRTVTPLEEPTQLREPAPPWSSREESQETSFRELALAQGTPGIDQPAGRLPPSHDFDESSQTTGVPFDEPPTTLRTPFSTDAHVTVAGMPFENEPPPDTSGARTAVRPSALRAHEVVALIKDRQALLARGANHFALLGLPVGAPIEDVNAAYVELSRHLQPTSLAELGIRDEAMVAPGLLAQIGIAFTILTDETRRPEYIAMLVATRRRRNSQPR